VRGSDGTWAERWRICRCGLVLAALSGLVVAPWLVRNWVVLGGFVPLRSNVGLELAVGNRPGVDGRTYSDGFDQVHPYRSDAERARLAELGELAYMREKKQLALTWIAEHPEEFARLSLRRALLFWLSPGEPLHLPVQALVGLGAVLAWFGLCRRNPLAAQILACALVGAALPYCITHVEQRYRFPIEGLLLLLVCGLGVVLVQRARDFAQRFSGSHSSPKGVSLSRRASTS
jgi:hypothetical protein